MSDYLVENASISISLSLMSSCSVYWYRRKNKQTDTFAFNFINCYVFTALQKAKRSRCTLIRMTLLTTCSDFKAATFQLT